MDVSCALILYVGAVSFAAEVAGSQVDEVSLAISNEPLHIVSSPRKLLLWKMSASSLVFKLLRAVKICGIVKHVSN